MELHDREAREQLVEIGRRMYEKHYVASNDGNLSVRVPGGAVWATPTGVSKGFMRAEDMVKLALDGTVLEQGAYGPSSEIKMHLKIYRENAEAMGVCHAHPMMSTSFAVAGIGLDEPIYPEAMVNLGSVPAFPMRRRLTGRTGFDRALRQQPLRRAAWQPWPGHLGAVSTGGLVSAGGGGALCANHVQYLLYHRPGQPFEPAANRRAGEDSGKPRDSYGHAARGAEADGTQEER